MKFFLALSALTALVSASECISISRRDDGNHTDPAWTCEGHIVAGCIEPNLMKHSQAFESQKSAVAVLGNRASLEVLAADIQTASQCVDSELASPSCEGVQLGDTGFDAIKLAATYLATPSHLDILVAASSTPCLVDESIAESAGMSLLMCYMSFMEHMQQAQGICPALDSLRTCSVSAVSAGCGNAAGAFLESVWEFAEDPEVHTTLLSMMEMSEMSGLVGNCHSQAALVKRFAKRAIDKMRK